jgi:7-carboxy-7-deazaguanine synthase
LGDVKGRPVGYAVKEIFKTLQGEGAQAGRAAVFCRFAGCNLWSGREEDRAFAVCRFCDTDFVGTNGPGGGRFATAQALAAAIEQAWDGGEPRRFVVFTGGEPLLQLDPALIDAVHAMGFEVAVETNGTQEPVEGIDWLCVSPKAGAPLRLRHGQEIKLVYPQAGLDPAELTSLGFHHFWLQPMDGPDRLANTLSAISYCLSHPRWRLSVQMHKLVGIP